ncbi:Hypp2758 [Branchiostoma lanceolatum]|uniref:Hypp2758 protein n=1 Tax=Branchiostoma lanceolatum TaxID=7740 RepID=A0A8J9ZUT6_BRALA|nr:Hypp2758 [Branchiostoma lanceolatum]
MFPHVFKMSSRVVCRQFVRGVTFSDKHAVVKGVSDGPNAGKPLTTGEVVIGVSAFGLVLVGPLLWTVSSIGSKRWGGDTNEDGGDNE